MKAGYMFTNFPMPIEGENAILMKCFSFVLIHDTYGPMLFDSGSPTQEMLFQRQLKELFGITGEDIRWVFNTHLHPDHIGCNRLCTNAKIVFSGKDFAHAENIYSISCSDGDLLGYYRETAPEYSERLTDFDIENIRYFSKNFFPPGQLRSVLGFNDNRAVIIEEGGFIPDCISVIDSPGHTFGSVTYKISLDPVPLFVTGDAVSSRYAFLSPKDEGFDEPALNTGHYIESLEKLEGLEGIIVPGHDRPFRSSNLKSIRKCPFDTSALTL